MPQNWFDVPRHFRIFGRRWALTGLTCIGLVAAGSAVVQAGPTAHWSHMNASDRHTSNGNGNGNGNGHGKNATPSPTPSAAPSLGATAAPTPSAATSSAPTATPAPTPTVVASPSSSPSPSAVPTPASTTPPPVDAQPGTFVASPTIAGIATQPSIGPGWSFSSRSVGLAPLGLSCSALPVYQPSGNKVPAGTVIDEKRITGWLDISAGGITIKRSCIQPTPGAVGQGTFALSTWGDLPSPDLIEDSEFDGSLLSQHDAAWIGGFVGVASMYRNYFHHFGSGIPLYGTSEKTGADVVIENNYVDDLVAYGDPNNGGNHQSAFTIRDVDLTGNRNRQVLVKDNYFACIAANCSGEFFIQPNDASISNLTAVGNLLVGNGYGLYLDIDPSRFPGVTYSNLTAIDNRIDNREFGDVFVRDGGPGWAQWSDMFHYSTTAFDGEGAVIPEP